MTVYYQKCLQTQSAAACAERLMRQVERDLAETAELQEEIASVAGQFGMTSAPEGQGWQSQQYAMANLAKAKHFLKMQNDPHTAVEYIRFALRHSVRANQQFKTAAESSLKREEKLAEVRRRVGEGMTMIGLTGAAAALAGGGAAVYRGTVALGRALLGAAVGGLFGGYVSGSMAEGADALIEDRPYDYSSSKQIASAVQGAGLGLMQGSIPFAVMTGLEWSESAATLPILLDNGAVVETGWLSQGLIRLSPVAAANTAIAGAEVSLLGGDQDDLAQAMLWSAGLTMLNGAAFAAPHAVRHLRSERIPIQELQGETLEGTVVYFEDPFGYPQILAHRTRPSSSQPVLYAGGGGGRSTYQPRRFGLEAAKRGRRSSLEKEGPRAIRRHFYKSRAERNKHPFYRAPDIRGKNPFATAIDLKARGHWSAYAGELERLLNTGLGNQPLWRHCILIELGKAYLPMTQRKRAAVVLREALRLQRTSEALIELAIVERHLGNADEALRLFEEAESVEGRVTPKILNERAITLNRLGKFEEAVQTLDQAIALESVEGTRFLARSLNLKAIGLIHLKRYAEALQAVELSVMNGGNSEEISKALATQAEIYWKMGNVQAAIQTCLEAIQKVSTRGSFYLLAADIYREQGRLEAARNILEDGLEKVLEAGQRYDIPQIYRKLLRVLVDLGEAELAATLVPEARNAGVSGKEIKKIFGGELPQGPGVPPS